MRRQSDVPPKPATWFLYRFLRHDLAEDVAGDLTERFYMMTTSRSRPRAILDYWFQVFAYLRPFAIRRLSFRNKNYTPMYKSYFTTSIRGMKKNKLHTVINMAGLSVGLMVAMVIGLWINDELSYEKKFENYERIGRVLQHVTNNGQVDTWWSVPRPLAEELRKNYGEDFTHVVLTTSPDEAVVSFEGKHLTQTGMFAEPALSEMLTLKMVSGSRSALNDASSILISQSFAKTYFDDRNPMGNVLTLNNTMTVQVAGVYRDLPEQSEFAHVNFVAPWQLLYNTTEWIKNMQDPWRPNAFSLYVALADNRSFEQVSATIRDAKLKHLSAELARKKPALFVHPMSGWHLYSRFRNGHQDGGLITYVWLFSIIGVFVVLMACMNFMNLTTARSEKRAREVGIRKAIGSYRSQLIQQFFSESVLTALFSFLLALLLVQLCLPAFNLMAGKHTALPWGDFTLWLYAVGLCVVTGILAGSYPAFYLSSITPLNALKGVFRASRSSVWSRKVMVVVQFTVSIVMIIGTAVVFRQIQHAKNRPIGYDTNGLVAVQGSDQLHQHIDAIRNELRQNGIIRDVAEADAPTTQSGWSSSSYDWNGKDPDLSVDFVNLGISPEYGKTVGWEIVEGRDFSRDFPSDSNAFIINEAAAAYLSLKDPVGETIRWYQQPFRVIGVVKDIVTNSPYDPVRPNFYFLNSGSGSSVLFRINPDVAVQHALTQLEGLHKKYNPGQPFNFKFIDESYALKFDNEERIGKLAGVFTMLAIFISCLGIFGLSSFIAEQRTREIGIRKVHGASTFQVWKMVSGDFVILALSACFIALPLAYTLAKSWVNRYEYHVTVSWVIPVFAGLAILFITLVTVSWHTIQAAKMSPAKSLKSE